MFLVRAVPPEEAHNFLTSAEKAAGWALLFDGRTLSAWQDPGKQYPRGDAWMVEEGCIKAVPKAKIPEDLVSKDTYRNFELEWDWRISAGGKSAVKYRVQAIPILSRLPGLPNGDQLAVKVNRALEDHSYARATVRPDGVPQIYPIGFEYQMVDNGANTDARHGPLYQSAALYGIVPPTEDMTYSVSAFNHSRLVVRGSHFKHWLNGKLVMDVRVSPDMLKQALAKRWGDRSLTVQLLSMQPKKSGPITLQNHGDEAWFRDIKIRNF